METIRTAVLCACCAALGLSLAEGILPPERFGRQIRLMLAMLMMTAILKPLTKLDFSGVSAEFSDAAETTEEIAALADQARQTAVAESIRNALNRALTENSVPCTVTDVHLHIQADGSIIINEVFITGNALTGSVYLREWLGDETVITEGGDALAGDD